MYVKKITPFRRSTI